MFRTADVIRLTGIPVHRLYYLERKGYVNPQRIPSGELELREFTLEDVRKVQVIWKYLGQGFKHRVAFRKALEELGSEGSFSPISPPASEIAAPPIEMSARRHE